MARINARIDKVNSENRRYEDSERASERKDPDRFYREQAARYKAQGREPPKRKSGRGKRR